MLYPAFRNCCRNIRRSILTAMALFLAVLVIVVMICFCDALLADMLKNSRDYTSGEIRIRNKLYSENEDVMPLQFHIPDVETMAEIIRESEYVQAAYPQSSMYLSAYVDGELKSISVIGVDTDYSAYTSGSGYSLNEGTMIRRGERELLATPHLLSIWNLQVGDRLTLVSKTAGGGTNGSTFLISGSVSYNSAELDGALLVMPADQLASLAGMDGGSLELLIRCREENLTAAIDEITALLGDESLEIASWHDTSWIYSLLPMYSTVYLCIELLFFLISSTLIFNTVMMSVLERKREISTMIALGFSRSSVRAGFILEGIMISTSGALIGAGASLFVMWLLSVTGIDLNLFGIGAVEGWGFSGMLSPSIELSKTVAIALTAILIAAAATFLATGRIGSIEVAAALRGEV